MGAKMKKLIFIIIFVFISISCSEVINNPSSLDGEVSIVGFAGMDITSIAINPINSNFIIVGTENPYRIFVSQDFGTSWSLSKDTVYSLSIEWSKTKPGEVYASNIFAHGIRPFLIKSTDYGKNWTESDSGIYCFDNHITRIETEQFRENVLYVLITQYPGRMPNAPNYLLVSTNSGLSFSNDIENNLYPHLKSYTVITDFAVSKSNNSLLFATLYSFQNDNELAMSTDGGNTWYVNSLTDEKVFCTRVQTNNKMVVIVVGNLSDMGFSKYKKWTAFKSHLYVSNDNGVNFKKIDSDVLDYLAVNDILITPENYIIFTGVLKSDSSKTVIYISKDQGKTWQKLSNDHDSKTLLAYDHRNKFLYFVKDKENKGLYRIKLR